MSALQTIQRDFQDYVLGTAGDTPAVAAHVLDQFGLPASERLAIYHNAYRIRMREALCDAYDKTWTLIGDELFNDLVAGYLDAHPSHFRNLRWFGDRFAAWCAAQLPDYPFVAELAALEWTLGLAFDAPDADAASVASMSTLPPERWGELTFALHPSVHFLDQRWNSVALWQALHDDTDPPEADELAAPQRKLIWRSDLRPQFRSIDADEADALARIHAGASFGAVCEAAMESGGDNAMLRIAGFLQAWLAQGLLTVTASLPSRPA